MSRLNSLVLLILMFLSSTAFAGRPKVEFDVVSTVAVAEVTSPDFPPPGPEEKLIAIRLKVSTYVSPESATQVSDVVVTLDSPSGNFQVVEFFPKTTLDTRFAGPVAVQTADDRKLGIDFDATGFYKSLTGATLTGSFTDQHYRAADFELLPPKEVVAASGTIQRGRGVYFKLRASSQDTIEGAKEFLVVARVPIAWRGDLARVRCTAGGEQSELFLPLDDTHELAQRDFLVGLYLEGDLQAQRAAERFVAAEQWLRRVACEDRSHIERDVSPKLLQKIGFAKPAVPSKWMNDVLYGPAKKEVLDRLPVTTRTAAIQYTAARTELHRLSGQGTPRIAARAAVKEE